MVKSHNKDKKNTPHKKNDIFRATSPIWDSFKNYKKGIRTTGTGRKQRFYEWDHTHNDIEVYDHNRAHIGSMNPVSGELYKDRVVGRTLNDD
jgi:hypothetical protein